MKRIFYFAFIALFVATTGSAQSITGYTVTNDAVVSPTTCPKTYIRVGSSISSLIGQEMTTKYDGLFYTSPVIGDSATFVFNINTPGNYTFKVVLDSTGGILHRDSLTFSITKSHCGFLSIGLFSDVNGNCIFDALDYGINNAAVVEVSLGGTPIDTISCYNNTGFMSSGTAGTVYQYRLLQPPVGYTLSCPLSGIIYDTVDTYNTVKRFGFTCSSTSDFDLQAYTLVRCAPMRARTELIVKNNYCTSVNSDLRILFSPKYNFGTGYYNTPTSISGNATDWHFLALTNGSRRYMIADYDVFGGLPLSFGDTVHSRYELTPTTGDLHPANNVIVRIDTVRAGWDPNDISVYPPRNISAGTELEYTIRFENTGNDTAFNIHVMDTVSDNVDFRTFKVVAASHNMNVTKYSYGTSNILKFDFPNINLLDSSHHGECSGMFVFTLNAKNGLPLGTQIFNRAGIFFDYNPVVMTNTVENIIPYPTSVNAVIGAHGASIFPNPAGDKLNIKIGNTTYNTATITNTIGQIMATHQLNNLNTSINIETLPTGIYFISLRGEKNVVVQKFEKQ